MTEHKKKLLTIGEIAKLTNLPIRTFHYYDEIGLFKPTYIDPKTNYRYYSESQVHYLDLIKSLKFVGTSLEDIKYAQSLTPEQLVHFLAEQEQLVLEKLKQMEEVHHTLLKTKKHLEEQINIPTYEKVYELDIAAQRILAIKTTDANVVHIPEKYFKSLTETVEREGSVMNSRYGGILELKDYQTIDEFYYSYIFTPLLTERYLEKLNSDVEVFNIPAGRYACIAFIYSQDVYVQSYQKLRKYVEVLELPSKTKVYELYMPTSYSPAKKSEFVVELKIKLP